MICHRAGAANSANLRRQRLCPGRLFSAALRGLLTAVFLLLPGLLFAGSERSSHTSTSSSAVPVFTIDQAIETALQRNPDVLTAKQEIRRTQGVVIEIRAQALPHLDAAADFTRTDRSLQGGSGGSVITTTTTTGGPTPTPIPGATPLPSATPGTTTTTISSFNSTTTEDSYSLRLTATQLVYSGSVIPAIKAAGIANDASFFALRNTIDQTIATVRQQFYQVILNRSLIGVQEESVQLLQSQLKDQQNRFEAGTVPRFNVLQAEVALANQQPALITARNNLRIAQLQLAKTIGLNFNPARGDSPPLEVKGELAFHQRNMPLSVAVELAKERRPLLMQERANVLSQAQQVGVAFGGFQPTLSLNGGYAFESSPFTANINDVRKGWFFGATGSWPIFDGLATVGRIKQARALLSEARIAYDNAVRQVELEVQQAYSNLQQDRQLVASQSKTVEQAREALRLASARLSVGAGVQLDVLNAQVALTQAQSTKLSALYSYNADLAEFDRVTATDTVYHQKFEDAWIRAKANTRMIQRNVTSRVEPFAK